MKRILFFSFLFLLGCRTIANDSTNVNQKQRLDFAKTYFEYGGSYMPSFTGKELNNQQQITSFTNPASLTQYLTWGAFHFWGHGEFYITIPLDQTILQKDSDINYKLIYSVATGARVYPWVLKENSIRPYFGFNWSALDFQQKNETEQPQYSKDFMLNVETGFIYYHKKLGLRLGITYFTDRKWDYPLSPTIKAEMVTPAYALQLGVLYSFDSSKNSKHEDADQWNDYPRVSKLSYKAKRWGDFFLGIGISNSYSLQASSYNQSELPYLKDKLISKPYLDFAVGYQFNKANFFIACSYRNPTYESTGFGTQQNINKHSIALEAIKYLTDYSGFAPFIGINASYDHIEYRENVNGIQQTHNFKNIEPGINFGWDIVPGKTSEAFILRTNLRWYPLSSFDVNNKTFDFSQLEYNLIQAVFYPGRLKWSK